MLARREARMTQTLKASEYQEINLKIRGFLGIKQLHHQAQEKKQKEKNAICHYRMKIMKKFLNSIRSYAGQRLQKFCQYETKVQQFVNRRHAILLNQGLQNLKFYAYQH